MMLGPQVSRPFVQSLHAFAAAGFVLVAFIMPYFLPTSTEDSDKICANLKNPNAIELNVTQEIDLPDLNSTSGTNFLFTFSKVT